MTDESPREELEAEVLALRERLAEERAARQAAQATAQRAQREGREETRALELLQEITALAHDTDSVQAALTYAMERVARFAGWEAAHVYWYDEDEDLLVPSDLWWWAEGIEFPRLREVTRETTFHPGEGLLGQVLTREAPVATEDLREAGGFRRKREDHEEEVSGHFAFPVTVGDDVVAVLEFFDLEVQEPYEDLLDVMGSIGAQLGRVIERERAHRQLEEHRQRLEEAQRVGEIGSWEWHLGSGEVTWSDQLCRLFGLEVGEIDPTFEAFLAHVHPEDRERVQANVERAVETQEPMEMEYRTAPSGGQLRWHTSRGQVLTNDAGAPVRMTGTVHDITERKGAELRVQQERRLLEAVMDAIQDPFTVLDRDWRYTHMNEAAEATLPEGVGYKEALDATLWELYPDLEDTEVAAQLREAMEAEEPASLEERDEETGTWWEIRVFPFEAGIAILFQDVTEQKEMQAALRAREEQFRSVIETAQDAIVSARADGTILGWNGGAEALFGYTIEEALGEPLTMLMPERYREAHKEGLARYLETGEARVIGAPVELEALHKDGREVPVELSLSRWTHDEEVRFTGILRDVTERQRAKEALLREGQRLSTIVETQQDVAQAPLELQETMDTVVRAASSVTGADGAVVELAEGDKMVYHAATGMAEEHLGMELDVDASLSGLCYRTGEAVVCPDTEEEPRVDREACRRIGLRSMVIVPLAYEGERFGVLKVLSREVDAFGPTDRETLELMAGLIAASISHTQLFEEVEEAREVAERSEKAKAEFLANMSHEIRTPMNAVIGMTGLLLDTELDDEQEEYVRTVRTSGDHLLTLLNDILDLSKIEAGKLELETQPFHLRAVVEESLDLVATTAQGKGLELAYLMDEAVPEGIHGDPGRLRQVLLNLLSNAVKFTEEGEVVVTVEPASPTGEVDEVDPEAPSRLLFEVRDTGIGIPEEKQDRLFQSFSQVDASTTRRYGGTGLGLTISRRLVGLMGGEMGVESQEGQGSTFWFTIGAQAAELPVARPERAPAGALRNMRVLIVDDNATNREILEHHLAAWGMDPHATDDPEEALAWAEEGQSWDLILLDYQMPGMDGLTLASRLTERLEHEPSVVLLTSVGLEPSEITERGVQLAGRLTKPIKPSLLYDALATALGAEPGAVYSGGPRDEVAFDPEMAQRLPLDILIAEDNPVNQKVARRILERLGYDPDVAADGNEVLQAVERAHYDVILMDVQMPGMDGYEATRRIRETLPEDRQPRIIALTAHAGPEARSKALDEGMDDHVAKPVDVEALVSALSRGQPGAPTDEG